jgi:hypothetical protein
MLKPAAALAALLLLTAFAGTDRMYFEQQPGRWLVLEDLMLDGAYVQQDESEICLPHWTRRTPEDFIAMAARGASCEITHSARDMGMMAIHYTCTDGPVREGKIRIGGSIDDLSVWAEADYETEDGEVVPAYIDTMFMFDGPCTAEAGETPSDPNTE